MKKFLFSILATILCFNVVAQEAADYNRMILFEKSGNFKAFNLEKADYIEFENIEGEIAAKVEVSEVTLEMVKLAVTRTASCEYFKINVFPSVRIASYSDEVLISLVEKESPYDYYEDFKAAEMTGANFQPSTDYTIVTVGYDIYGVAGNVEKVDIITPSKPIVGNPQVEVEITDTQTYQFTVKFTPNEDVSKYSYVAGEKGAIESQYEMFAPMFGYQNIGQLIEAWGISQTEASEYTWTSMSPGTEYEIFVQVWDAEGTMAPHEVYTLTTSHLGGEGTAEVTITLGDYKLTDWGGEMLPSQFVTFTPNDQSSAYRFSVYLAETYDADAEAIKAELCSEPPMPMSGWFFYEEITTDYQINPNTEFVVIAAAKNTNGEWGPITELRHTTPAEASAAAPSRIILKRNNLTNTVRQLGTLPEMPKTQNIKLLEK